MHKIFKICICAVFLISGARSMDVLDEEPNAPKTFVGGVECDIKDYPYMVQISEDGKTTTCTGVLMAARMVITSGRCIRDPTETYLIFHRNEKWKGKNGGKKSNLEQVVKVNRCHRHKKYVYLDKHALYDIAICTMKKKIPDTPPLKVYRHRRYGGDFREYCINFLSIGWNSLRGYSDKLMCMKEIGRYHKLDCTDLPGYNEEGHYLCTERFSHRGGGARGAPLICGNMQIGIWKGQRRDKTDNLREPNLITLWTKTFRHQDFINAIKEEFHHPEDWNTSGRSGRSGGIRQTGKSSAFVVFLIILLIFNFD